MTLPIDSSRRHRRFPALTWLIGIDAAVFAMLFVSYFYLRLHLTGYRLELTPSLTPALSMLGILSASILVMRWGVRAMQRDHVATSQLAIVLTMALGSAFLVLQISQLRAHLRIAKPTEEAAGTIFYALTGLHAAHVAVGLLALVCLLLATRKHSAERSVEWILNYLAMYWRLIAMVWAAIVLVLFIGPRISLLG